MKNCINCGTPMEDQDAVCKQCEGNAPAEESVAPEAPETSVAESAAPEAVASIVEEKATTTAATSGFTMSAGEGEAGGKKPVSKALMGAIAGVAVLAVILIAVFARGGGGGVSADYGPLFDAMNNTGVAMSEEFSAFASETGVSDLAVALEDSYTRHTFAVGVAGDEAVGDVKFDVIAEYNPEGTEGYVELLFDLMGQSGSIMQISYVEHVMTVASPLLLSNAYSLNLENIETTLPNSTIGSLLGITEESMTEMMDMMFPAGIDAIAATEEFTFTDATNKAVEDAADKFNKACKLSEGKDETVTVNGISRDCVMYVMNIPPAAVETYYAETLSAVFKDENFLALMQQSMAFDSALSGYSSTEEYLTDIETEINAAISEMMTEVKKIELLGYVHDEQFVRGDLVLTGENSRDEVFFVLEIGGEKNLTDEITLTIESTMPAQKYVVKHAGNMIPENGVVDCALTVSYVDVADDSETVYAEGGFYWDSKAAADNFNVAFDIVDVGGFSIEGTMLVDEKFTLDIPVASFYDSYGDETTLSFSWVLEPIDALQTVSGSVINVLDMDMAQLMTMMEEIQTSAESLSGLFAF